LELARQAFARDIDALSRKLQSGDGCYPDAIKTLK
jgi:hypothetical protein